MRRKTKWREAKRAISVLCVGGAVVRLVSTTPKRLEPIWHVQLPLWAIFFSPERIVGDIDSEQSGRTLMTVLKMR